MTLSVEVLGKLSEDLDTKIERIAASRELVPEDLDVTAEKYKELSPSEKAYIAQRLFSRYALLHGEEKYLKGRCACIVTTLSDSDSMKIEGIIDIASDGHNLPPGSRFTYCNIDVHARATQLGIAGESRRIGSTELGKTNEPPKFYIRSRWPDESSHISPDDARAKDIMEIIDSGVEYIFDLKKMLESKALGKVAVAEA